MEKDSHIKIFLDSIEVPLKLGLLPHEHNKPQRVLVTAEVYADPAAYLREVSPETIIDYAVLYEGITSWAHRPHAQLIEDYLKELLDLCFGSKSVTAARLSIKKADIFGKDQGAGIEVFMHREDWPGHSSKSA
jgi:dihydroneopterin aldolase